MEDMICPKCGSTSTYRSKKFNAWICERFVVKSLICQRKWQSGTTAYSLPITGAMTLCCMRPLLCPIPMSSSNTMLEKETSAAHCF